MIWYRFFYKLSSTFRPELFSANFHKSSRSISYFYFLSVLYSRERSIWLASICGYGWVKGQIAGRLLNLLFV